MDELGDAGPNLGAVGLDGQDPLEHDDRLRGSSALSQVGGECRQHPNRFGIVPRPVERVGQMQAQTSVLRVRLELQLEQLDGLGMLPGGDQLADPLLLPTAKPFDHGLPRSMLRIRA